jgi:hypothetical protein
LAKNARRELREVPVYLLVLGKERERRYLLPDFGIFVVPYFTVQYRFVAVKP